MKRIAIIGAGSWGTALAVIAARAGHEVQLWSRNAELVDSINHRHVNPRYLTSVEVPTTVAATNDAVSALFQAEHVLFAAPSHAARELFTTIASHLHENTVVVS